MAEAESTPSALDGVRIVELAAGLAVAYAGKLLAQAGAEVIRIESPLGDGIRYRQTVQERALATTRWCQYGGVLV